MITREAVEWCLYIGCLLPLITGYPFIITMLFLLLPAAMMLPYAAMGIHSGYWPGLPGWLPWMSDTSGTTRVAPDGTYHAKSSTSVGLCREFGECPAPADLGSDGFYTRGSGTETSEYVRTSGCGWRTEMRISSAKDGHKPAMTTMWLKKGHGFELRRLLMRKKPVQIALVSTNRWMQPNSLIWMCHHSNVSRVKTQVPKKSSSMTRRIRWWSKSDVLLTDSGPGNYMIGKHRVHLQVLSGWSAFTTGVSMCVQQPLWPGVTEMGSSAYFCLHDLGWVSTTLGNHVEDQHPFRLDLVVPFYAAKTARRSGKTTWAEWTDWFSTS